MTMTVLRRRIASEDSRTPNQNVSPNDEDNLHED